MSNLEKNIQKIKTDIKTYQTTIICASKYIDHQTMRKLFTLGITHFGENRVDELLNKKAQLKDFAITWHFIGNLQSNKVKQIINEIDYLHSLDRISLAKEIQKHRKDPLKTFIQLNLTNEQTKSGININNLEDFIQQIKKYDKINVIGFMTIGKEADLMATEEAFKLTNELTKKYNLKEKSMGMSEDYLLALKYQATFLRLGRILLK